MRAALWKAKFDGHLRGPNNLVYSEEFSTPYNYDRERTEDDDKD